MDEEGAFPVFEAVLVAVLVLTSLVFVSSLRTPSQGEGAGGIDFGRVAADTLRILEERPEEVASDLYDGRLEEIVTDSLSGDPIKVDKAEKFLKDLLPEGSRYVLRIDNGVEPITLVPQGEGPGTHPKAARAAGTFILPDWTVNADEAAGLLTPIDTACAAGEIDCSYPGGDLAVDFTTVTTLTAPDGSTTAPDGGTWKAWWLAERADTGLVPTAALYGVWKTDAPLEPYFRITHPDGTETDRPVYGIQMVVWYGA